MNKNVLAAIGSVAVLLVGFVGYKALSLRSEAAKWSGPMEEIAEEKITHDDNITHARFVSIIDAPVDTVQKAIWSVENSQQMVENIKLSNLIENKGNTKTVELNILALNLPLQAYTMEWTLYPDEHRVTSKTTKSQAQDIETEYKLEPSPDGAKTRLIFTTTIKDKIAVPFPQSVLDSANREIYVNTVRGIQKFAKQGGKVG
jgi:hypothetical protein